jgi:hypothetical protein
MGNNEERRRRRRNIERSEKQEQKNRESAAKASAGYEQISEKNRLQQERNRKKREREEKATEDARIIAAQRRAELENQNREMHNMKALEGQYKNLFREAYPTMSKRNKIIKLSKNWLNITIEPTITDRRLRATLHPDQEKNSDRKAKKTVLTQYI